VLSKLSGTATIFILQELLITFFIESDSRFEYLDSSHSLAKELPTEIVKQFFFKDIGVICSNQALYVGRLILFLISFRVFPQMLSMSDITF